MIFKYIFLLSILGNAQLLAKVSVITTTANLKSIVKEVGGTKVTVFSFCKGTQDPHFLEAKPSYMIKTSQADLVLAVGLGLEVGWLPKVLAGGRNSDVMPGSTGYLEVGPLVDLLEIPKAGFSRADGDVHPEGNPHVLLDPSRAGNIGEAIAVRLGAIDPKNAVSYRKRAGILKERLIKKSVNWKKRIELSGIKKLVTYHKSFAYFFQRFQLSNPAILEPFPGVPPTGRHILSVIKKTAAQGVKLILVENYFNETSAKRVARDVPGVKVASVPVSVGGHPGVNSIDDLYEALVSAIENGAK